MIELTKKGLFCPAGGFYIDPSRAVDVALITHAHSDHARRGSKQYFCTRSSVGLLQKRLGRTSGIEGVDFGQKIKFNDVWVSFHPAGHILGSAQIRVESSSEVWVVSGDYKRESDASCEPFEVVPCDTFITEATFGHPQYQWDQNATPVAEIAQWWQNNRAEGKNSLLLCYALGKTQRVLAELGKITDSRVLVAGEAADLTACYRNEGIHMIATENLEDIIFQEPLRGELIVAPHSILKSSAMQLLGNYETAFASGWMQNGNRAWGQRYDRGFVISDHADWPALVHTAQETGARKVYVLHGKDPALVKHLRKLGVDARTAEDLIVSEAVQGRLF